MAMVGLMITVMRTCEACALHAMLDVQGSRAQRPCMRSDHED
jgi:hypothetical protein